MHEFKMLEYIHETPEVLTATLQHNEDAIIQLIKKAHALPIQRIVLTGLGSSYTAALMAKPIFERYAWLPVLVIEAEEMPYYADSWIKPDSLVMAASRSGERQSVVDAVDLARERNAIGLAITGVADSLLAQHADTVLLTQEGPEITFPKTKSVSTCAAIFMRIGLEIARQWQLDDNSGQMIDQLSRMPDHIDHNIKIASSFIKEHLDWIIQHHKLNVSGTCSNIGVAMEAGIKVQEASYIPTRGSSTAGLLQGPIGALDSDWLAVALVMPSDLALNLEMLELVQSFGARSICVCAENIPPIPFCDRQLYIKTSNNPYLAALEYLPFIQLLAYFWTVILGMNPDAPSSMDSILKKIVPEGRDEPEFRQK